MNPQEIQYIIDHEHSNTSSLLLGKRVEGIDIPLCVKCIEARKKMKSKVPQWYSVPSLIYPFSLSVEQCSSQSTALYKYSIAKRIMKQLQLEVYGMEEGVSDKLHEIGEEKLLNNPYKNIADITGGMGVDSFFLSNATERLYYFERNKELSEAAAYNFIELNNKRIIVRNIDITGNVGVLKEKEIGLIYADPARREGTEKHKKGVGITAAGKLISISDYEPDIIALKEELFKYAPYLLVKISPMADIKLNMKLLPETTEIHVVSVNNECKELLFLLKKSSIKSNRTAMQATTSKRDGTIIMVATAGDTNTRVTEKEEKIEAERKNRNDNSEEPVIYAVNLVEEGKQGNFNSFKFTYSEEKNSHSEFAELFQCNYSTEQSQQQRQTNLQYCHQEELHQHLQSHFQTQQLQKQQLQKQQETKAIFNCTNEAELILLEPNKSLLKAGAFKTVAQRYSLKKIAPSTHLYLTEANRKNEMLSNFPGKVFAIKEIYKYNQQSIKTLRNRITKANLCARNFPINTDALKQKMKIVEGGEEYLFAITENSGERVLIHAIHLS